MESQRNDPERIESNKKELMQEPNKMMSVKINKPTMGQSYIGCAMSKLPIFLLFLAAIISTGEAIATINIFKHRYPFYGGYGYGYPYYHGGYSGYGGINIGGYGWGR